LKWKNIFVTAFVAALANCVANHVVDCLFQKVGLPCPRDSA
jgi:hypothetical protein